MDPGVTAAISASTAASTAAAAAVAAERQRQEEEEMTAYSPQDLADDWEFKILRSHFASFKHPDQLAQILEEEARAGWVLVEKFDDTRIRLKRPVDARRNDVGLDFDPYRTSFTEKMPERTKNILIGVALCFVLTVAVGVLIAFLADQ